MTIEISIPSGDNGFAENKDEARELRTKLIIPGLDKNETILLDFSRARLTTQSFVHALIGEVLKRYGDKALDHIEFKGCNAQVQAIISLVVEYSLGDIQPELGVKDTRAKSSKLREKKSVRRRAA